MIHHPERPWVALVTFEKSLIDNNFPDLLSVLDSDILGASGWMAVDAPTEKMAHDVLTYGLQSIGLKVVEIQNVEDVIEISEYRNFDEYLFENVQSWELGKQWVWGTVFQYYAEGEA